MTAQQVIAQAYAAFNRRDIDAALALMTENVSWPKASEGGRVIGKDAIRAYWTRQWSEFDPRVDVRELVDGDCGEMNVRVHQLVKDHEGNVLSDTDVWHVYTIADGLIERMEFGDGDASSEGPSAAFSAGAANDSLTKGAP